jgi:UDP-glucose 4-epimerase
VAEDRRTSLAPAPATEEPGTDLRRDLPGGVYNAAADGVLALSEVADLLGKLLAPVLPPWGTSLAAAVAKRAGITLSPEILGLLRFGRGLDNRKLKATGFRYTYTSREAVGKLREHQRLAAVLRGTNEAYRYEADVEEFLRRSPSVRPTVRRTRHAPANLAPGVRRSAAQAEDYDALDAAELIALLPSLEPAALQALAEHEAAHARRPDVLDAIAGLQR